MYNAFLHSKSDIKLAFDLITKSALKRLGSGPKIRVGRRTVNTHIFGLKCSRQLLEIQHTTSLQLAIVWLTNIMISVHVLTSVMLAEFVFFSISCPSEATSTFASFFSSITTNMALKR